MRVRSRMLPTSMPSYPQFCYYRRPRLLLALVLFAASATNFVGQAQTRDDHRFLLDDLSRCLPVNARPCKEEETRGCESNFLKRPTIVLMAGPWESSILTAWIAEIILSEVLRFPVYLAGDAGGRHDFYEEGAYTLNPARKYAFDALQNADASPNLQCDLDYIKRLSVPDGIRDEPACQPDGGGNVDRSCKPCAHAILDVWSDGQQAVQSLISAKARHIRLGAEIGTVGGFGVYTLASVRNQFPELATFRGLQEHAKAGMFGKAMTLGEYCKSLRALERGFPSELEGIYPTGSLVVTGDNAARIATITLNNHGYLPGDLVKVSRAEHKENNGVKTVKNADTNTFSYDTVAPVKVAAEPVLLGIEQYDGKSTDKQSFCYVFYTFELEIGEAVGKQPTNLDLIETCANSDWSKIIESGNGFTGPWSPKNTLSEEVLKLMRNVDPEAAAAADADIAEAAATPPKNPLELCARYIVTEADFGRVARNLGPSDLETFKQFSGTNPLYPGYFVAIKDSNDNLPVAAMHVPGCRLEAEKAAAGFDLMPPGGAQWDHSHVDLGRWDALRIRHAEVGSRMHEVFDASARKADPTEPTRRNMPENRPVLLQWFRPNSAFERYKYYISSVKPGVYDGDDTFIKAGGNNYRLARVPLAKWSESCEAARRTNYDGMCPPSGSAGGTQISAYNGDTSSWTGTVPWKDTCAALRERGAEDAWVAKAQKCQTVRSCAKDADINYCVGGSTSGPTKADMRNCDESLCSIGEPTSSHCDYREERPRRVTVARLEELAPEASHFLQSLRVTTEDLESIMGKWAYDGTFTDYPNQVKRRRHAVCEWVKSNWEGKIQEYLYGGWNTTRCLGELGARIDPSGRYTPGTPCSGHGRCVEDKKRDSTRTTLAEIAAAAAAAQPQFVVNEEEQVVPTEEEEAEHMAKQDAERQGPFYAGVCVCDRGYVGDDCGSLGVAEVGDVYMTDGIGLLATASFGAIGVFIFFMIIFTLATRHEPLMNYCSSRYCILIETSASMALGSLPLWFGAPDFLSCALRPSLILLAFNLYTGTIFARCYRTTFILWGKSPPNVVITDPLYMMSILKKQSTPLVILLVIFVLSSFIYGANRKGRLPEPFEYVGYGYCEYGTIGDSVLAAAVFYVAMIGCWTLVLLYYLKKRVEYTSREPFYHGERVEMTRAMIWVMLVGAAGFSAALIFERPSDEMPNNVSLKFIAITTAIGFASFGGVFRVIWPKYVAIYMYADRNKVFKGERFSVPIEEAGRTKNVEPTIDSNDIDPRLLRKNIELLKENLSYADEIAQTKEELTRLHKLVTAYERSARAVTPQVLNPMKSKYVARLSGNREATSDNGEHNGLRHVEGMTSLGTVSNPSLPGEEFYDDEYYDEDGSWNGSQNGSWNGSQSGSQDGRAESNGENREDDVGKLEQIQEVEEEEGEEEEVGEKGVAGRDRDSDNSYLQEESRGGGGEGEDNLNPESTSVDTYGKDPEDGLNAEINDDGEDDDEQVSFAAQDQDRANQTTRDDDERSEGSSRISRHSSQSKHTQGSRGSKQSPGSKQSRQSKQTGSNLRVGFDEPGTAVEPADHPKDLENGEIYMEEGKDEGEYSDGVEADGEEEQVVEPLTLHETIDQVSLDEHAQVDPFAPVQVLDLPNRLENLLYSTEAQAGALLREMDAIREDRERDRALLRERTKRVNDLVEKTNKLGKQNKKLVRTLHNRSTPLPTIAQILSAQNLSQYERLFAKKKINSAKLISMDDDELWHAVGMKRGHRRRLMAAIKKYLVGPKMPKLPTPLPTPVPSEPSTARYSELVGGDQDGEAKEGNGTDASGSNSGSESDSMGSGTDGSGLGSASEEEDEGEEEEDEVAIDVE